MGAFRVGPGNNFEWEDGSFWGYDSWSDGEPDDNEGNEDNVVINWSGDGMWNDEAPWFDYRCLFAKNVSK